MLRPLAAALAIAAASLLLVAPAPSYDPWAWLLWGRELAGGGLSTLEGPAFKPLPVAVCALLAPLGSAAPWLWVLLVRTAALLAAWLAYGLGRRLVGGDSAQRAPGAVGARSDCGDATSVSGAGALVAVGARSDSGDATSVSGAGALVAGVLAAVGVLLCGGMASYTAAGAEPALVIALALGGAAAWRAERFRLALACGAACALVRVEAWPFLLLAGVALWRRRPQDRPLLVALALAIPAAWLAPELAGSGDLLRSGARARVPNPGQPALADVPGLAALEAAIRLPLWPLWLGVAALLALRARAALAPAAAGAAWIALVALMAQAGFSGEPRYALPGAALIAISGAVGLVLAAQRITTLRAAAKPASLPGAKPSPQRGAKPAGLPGAEARPLRAAAKPASSPGAKPPPRRAAAGVAVVLVALAAAPRVGDVAALRDAQAYQWRLAADLADAVRAVGGRDAVLACGRPYVGPLRGPLMAYRIDVAKHIVEPDDPPRPPGMVFRSSLRATATPAPAAPAGFTEVARAGGWQVLSACAPS